MDKCIGYDHNLEVGKTYKCSIPREAKLECCICHTPLSIEFKDLFMAVYAGHQIYNGNVCDKLILSYPYSCPCGLKLTDIHIVCHNADDYVVKSYALMEKQNENKNVD